MPLYKDGHFVDDAWQVLGAEDLPGSGPSILPLKRWLALREASEGTNVPIGVRVEAGESIDPLVADLDRISLVALDFPKWNDGRSFSKAALLRQTYRFGGEIRAVGDVLWDQLQLMQRCGFDAYDIRHEPTIAALRRGKKPFMTEFYQPGLGPEEKLPAFRAWARRVVPS